MAHVPFEIQRKFQGFFLLTQNNRHLRISLEFVTKIMLQIAIKHSFHAYELSIPFRGIQKQEKSKFSVELIFSWGKSSGN